MMSIRNRTVIKIEDNLTKPIINYNNCNINNINCKEYKLIKINAVEAQFDFCFKNENHKICMNKGEIFKIINKTNDDWWLIRRLIEINYHHKHHLDQHSDYNHDEKSFYINDEHENDEYNDDDEDEDDNKSRDSINENIKSSSSSSSLNEKIYQEYKRKSSSTSSYSLSSYKNDNENVNDNDDKDDTNGLNLDDFYAPVTYLKEIQVYEAINKVNSNINFVNINDNHNHNDILDTCSMVTSSHESLDELKTDDEPPEYDCVKKLNENICDNNNSDYNSNKLFNLRTFTTPTPSTTTSSSSSSLTTITTTTTAVTTTTTTHSTTNINELNRKYDDDNLPIYANLKIKTALPPIPLPGSVPLRVLLNHWSEYLDNSGRKFYYNSVTRESSWKPPRKDNRFDTDYEDYFDEDPPDYDIDNDDDDDEEKYDNDDDDDDVRNESDLKSYSEENLTHSHIPSEVKRKSNTISSMFNYRNKYKLNDDEQNFRSWYDSPRPSLRLSKLKRGAKVITKNVNINNNFNNNNQTTNDNNNLKMQQCLPTGWTRHIDKTTNQLYFVNNKTKGKWFCKLDENGRLYFFEEDGTESFCELPDLNDDLANEETSLESTSIETSISTNLSKLKQPSLSSTSSSSTTYSLTNTTITTPIMATSTKIIKPFTRYGALERNIKARSMAFLPINDKFASIPIIPTSLLPNDNKMDDKKVVAFPPLPPATYKDAKIIQKGILNGTKLMENGRRVRKNWCPCLVALSDYYLMLFKETKLISDSLKPETVIELSGALAEWSQKSSRKNVFQVTTVSGNLILLQHDSPITCKSWLDAIKCAILKLPSVFGSQEIIEKENTSFCKLKRSRSTKLEFRKVPNQENDTFPQQSPLVMIPPDKKKKIRERLRLFLRRRPTLENVREKGIYKDEPVFGCNLKNLCQNEKQNVPKFVKECIQAVEERDLKTEGVYRHCGNLSLVQKLRYQVDRDNYSGLNTEDDIHVLASALKLFFREMVEPLFPCNIFEQLMVIIENPDHIKKLDTVYNLVRRLPAQNYETLKYLLQHLLRVKSYSDENRMHVQNLAIVFGPTLMRLKIDTNNFAHDMMVQLRSNQIVEFLLLNFDEIFH